MQVGVFVAATAVAVAYVGYNYEDIVVRNGWVDPADFKKKRQIENNPLPLELRDEYVCTDHPDPAGAQTAERETSTRS